MKTTEIVKCMNQVFRSKIQCHVDGWGDCTTCETDEKNFWCKGYTPFTIRIFALEEAEEKEPQRMSA